MSGERGQALLVVVVALAISAVAIVGLRYAQDRAVTSARVQRTGEAAVEAAAAYVADEYVRDRLGAKRLLTDPRVLAATRAAAQDLASRNGGGLVERLQLSCTAAGVEVSLVLSGFSHRAGFAAPECSQP